MRRGFTLLELLMVVGIMGMMMMIAVVAFVQMGKGSAMKSTVMRVRSSISHARQYAITRHVPALFVYGNTNMDGRLHGYYYVATNRWDNTNEVGGAIGPLNFATDGILFSDPAMTSSRLTFDVDGSCDAPMNTPARIVLYEASPTTGDPKPNGLTTTTSVYRLTGRVKGGGWVNE